MDELQVGRAGFDDGLVLMVGLRRTASTAGSAFTAAPAFSAATSTRTA